MITIFKKFNRIEAEVWKIKEKIDRDSPEHSSNERIDLLEKSINDLKIKFEGGKSHRREVSPFIILTRGGFYMYKKWFNLSKWFNFKKNNTRL